MMNFFSNKKGASAIMLTILIMGAMLFVALTAADIIQNGLQITRVQKHSTKAYYAAEAGAERILWEIRKNYRDPVADNWGNDKCIKLESGSVSSVDCHSANSTHDLTYNNTSYEIRYNQTGDTSIPGDAQLIFSITGDKDQETRRVVEISFRYN